MYIPTNWIFWGFTIWFIILLILGFRTWSSYKKPNRIIKGDRIRWHFFWLWLFGLPKKHLWCRWLHKYDRCYPGCSEGTNPNYWHCAKCHPCGEALDILMEFFLEEDKKAAEVEDEDFSKM